MKLLKIIPLEELRKIGEQNEDQRTESIENALNKIIKMAWMKGIKNVEKEKAKLKKTKCGGGLKFKFGEEIVWMLLLEIFNIETYKAAYPDMYAFAKKQNWDGIKFIIILVSFSEFYVLCDFNEKEWRGGIIETSLPYFLLKKFFYPSQELIFKILGYFEFVYKKGELNMEEFIEKYLEWILEAQRIEEIKNISIHTKSLEDAGSVQICEFPDKGKRIVHREEIPSLVSKFIEKIEIPYFSYEEGKIINLPFYTYKYEEIEKKEEEIKIEYDLKPKNLNKNEFKEKIKLLEKFGIFYSDEILERFFSAINSANKFIILAGATGTGKTLLSLIYPAIIYHKGNKSLLEIIIKKVKDEDELKKEIQENLRDYLLLVPVRPNWVSPRDLIGYYNPLENDINRKFVKGILYDFLVRAEERKDKHFFLILDEMNLSHPEHYLSDILSAMETRGRIYIHEDDEIEKIGIKKSIFYPEGLYIIGTINIDETTKELSPRLKSRAFCITLETEWDKYKVEDETGIKIKEILKIIDENLKKIDLSLGYRDFKHVYEYVKKGGKLDEVLVLKIIPRIKTTDEEFKNVAGKIEEELKNYNLFLFIKEIENLVKKFEKQGFV